MSRVRRFALVAVLTLSAGAALTGCQSAPGVAATVGDVRLTDARVEEIVAQINTDVTEADVRRLAAQQSAQPSGQPQPSGAPLAEAQGLPTEVYGSVRQQIVEFTVFNELARRYAAEQGLVLPAQDYQAAAAQIGVSESNPYVKLAVDSGAYHQLLESNAERGTPTEADLREAHRRAVAAGAVGPDVTFEQVRPDLEGFEQIATGVWLRDELAAIAARVGVLINPRYRPIEFATGSLRGESGTLVLVALVLGVADGSPAVRDVG